MLFTPIYIAMTFIKTWRIRSFRARLLEFLNGNTSVAFCKVPENVAETPTLSSKLCTNPKNAYLCDLLDYTNTTRVCSMKPTQCIDINGWVTCSGGMPLGSGEVSPVADLDLEVLFECEMEPHEDSVQQSITYIETIGEPIAWKASTHLAIVLKTNIEQLSAVGFDFVGGEFIIDHKLPVVRIQTIQLTGEPNKATDISMRGLRSDIQHGLKNPPNVFQWAVHAALLRKLSKVVDIKSDITNVQKEMNGNGSIHEPEPVKKTITLADVSVNTGKSLTEDDDNGESSKEIAPPKSPDKEPQKQADNIDKDVVLENVTIEIQHNITPRKSSLRLDLKKGATSLSTSLMNISSQIKSVTTHKRIVSSTAPKKSQQEKPQELQQSTSKSAKGSRPLVNTKSLNIVIYSDSATARDNLEASLRKVLDCERYTICGVSGAALAAGAWRGRAALLAVAGCCGAACPLLLAHLLAGGRLLALCSDLLHTVLPYYKTAEIRENEVVQFTFDKWKSVKMKHHIFCYQASPAKKQFSTENDRQPSKYTGHPGHELDIQVLASEETWRTPSLLQAVDLTNGGISIFSQIHLETDPSDYLGEEGIKTNEVRLQILHKILGDILGLHVVDTKQVTQVEYTRGYFLGNHVQKLALVEELCSSNEQRVSKFGPLTVQWCGRGEPTAEPSETFLPVHVYECPEHFDTVQYFDNLTTKHIGRLVIYTDVISSTTHILETKIAHGLCVVARRQSSGRGRGRNTWLSPIGQAIISIQIWQKMSPYIPLIQYVATLAAVKAIRSQPQYEQLDIRIKWPNDIYYGRDTKIGGVLTTANCMGDDVTINIGIGVNISNEQPTTCVNAIISEYNSRHGATLRPLGSPLFLARCCDQLERILDYVTDGGDGGVDAFLDDYYQYWLHENEEIEIKLSSSSAAVRGRISGLDRSGFLLVRTAAGLHTVQPDGNTFDIMAGLIAPK